MPQVHYFQYLMVGDARVHEAGGDMDREAETREPAPAFEPARNIIGKCYSFLRDPQDHLARLYYDMTSVLYMHGLGQVLKIRTVMDMIGLCSFLECPEIVAECKIDRAGPDLLLIERFDLDCAVL